jgi:hypothetical protein
MCQSPFWFGLVWGCPLSFPSLLFGLLSPAFLTRQYFMMVAFELLLAPCGQCFDYVLFTGALGTGFHQCSHPQLFLGSFWYYRHLWRYLAPFFGFIQGARLYYISSFRLVYGALDLWLRRFEGVAASDREGVSGLPWEIFVLLALFTIRFAAWFFGFYAMRYFNLFEPKVDTVLQRFNTVSGYTDSSSTFLGLLLCLRSWIKAATVLNFFSSFSATLPRNPTRVHISLHICFMLYWVSEHTFYCRLY